MVKICLSFILIFAGCTFVSAQQATNNSPEDTTTKHLPGLTVRGYLIEQPVLSVPASVSVLGPAQLSLQPENSLVSSFNTVPGVRMEERSPGSYQLSYKAVTFFSLLFRCHSFTKPPNSIF